MEVSSRKAYGNYIPWILVFFYWFAFFLLPLNFNNNLAEYNIWGSYFFPWELLFWHWMLVRDLLLTCFFLFNRWFFFLPQRISLWLWKLITLLGCIPVLVVLMTFSWDSIPFQSVNMLLFWKIFENCFWNFSSSIMVIFFKLDILNLVYLFPYLSFSL